MNRTACVENLAPLLQTNDLQDDFDTIISMYKVHRLIRVNYLFQAGEILFRVTVIADQAPKAQHSGLKSALLHQHLLDKQQSLAREGFRIDSVLFGNLPVEGWIDRC